MRILHLYRPRLPSTRAQAIQVIRTCHALAQLGHDVTVLADRGHEPDMLWKRMGLPPLPSLDVQIAPFRHPGMAGLWFRWRLRQWWSGPPGVVLARDKRRLLSAEIVDVFDRMQELHIADGGYLTLPLIWRFRQALAAT